MLDVLSQQIMLSGISSSTTGVTPIVRASGHTLLVGWETIFGVLGSASYEWKSQQVREEPRIDQKLTFQLFITSK
ncbi:hypothetical protein BC827DRAFT_1242007 [Russula dissimulans]|nr:hypothetical protein BC827DRAFT_1242007 [Russula dissimulans]